MFKLTKCPICTFKLEIPTISFLRFNLCIYTDGHRRGYLLTSVNVGEMMDVYICKMPEWNY